MGMIENRDPVPDMPMAAPESENSWGVIMDIESFENMTRVFSPTYKSYLRPPTCLVTGVTGFIEDTDKGFDAVLSEDVTFSQGQAQRLALTKALLSGYDIILLDEIESSLDTTQRNAIKGILSTVSESRLVILVTHSDLYDEIAKDVLYFPPIQP